MLGETIRKYRKEKGLSQEQLARKLHITQGAISQWEKNKTMPEGDQIRALADVLGVTVGMLFEDDQRMEKDPQTDKPQRVDNAMIRALMELPPDKVKLVREFLALPNDQALRLLGYFEGLKAASEDSPSAPQKDS